ncbi:T9SS type A sorting domain-containing protein [Sungkyunkwania multivorans]|uniref:T9SS type A sorting domain-containing protein n=1 Tax=Sungkyunkwania multivorans TaxID=1173618 RepID=A0ABW3D0I1_9FLAO
MRKADSIRSLPIYIVFFLVCFSTIGQVYPRIRIGFEDALGYHRPLLLTFIPGTTSNVDFGFDGALSSIENTDSYWLIENGEYAIQAIEEPINSTELPLGVSIETARDIFFMINALENMSQSFEILLKDTDQATLHDLKQGNFQVSLAAGTYLNRFSLVVFPSSILGVEDQYTPEHVKVAWNKDSKLLHIEQGATRSIDNATIFDAQGRKVVSKKIDEKISLIHLSISQGIYFLHLDSGDHLFRKRIVIY